MKSFLSLSEVQLRRAGRTLLDGIDLDVGKGTLLALLGPNGAGKTTILRVLLALIAPDSGSARVDGRDVGSLSMRERAALMAWLPQNSPRVEALSPLEIVAAARYRFDEPRGKALEVATTSLETVGAGGYASRTVDKLSGGESQRVALAALLAQEARAWLVDEPANHLDPAQQVRTYRFLGERVSAGTTIICVTHDVNLLRHARNSGADQIRVVGVSEGRIDFDSPLDGSDLGGELSNLFGIDHTPHGDGASGIWIVGGEAPS